MLLREFDIYPAPDRGTFITRLTGGGAIFASSPQKSGIAGLINKIQTAFDRSGKFIEGNIRLTSGSPMTSQIKMFDYLAYLDLSSTTAVSNGIIQYNNMDRVWDTL